MYSSKCTYIIHYQDFISATTTTSGNQQPVQTYQSVAQVMSRHSVTVSWGTLETRTPQNVTFALGDDDDDLLQQNQGQCKSLYKCILWNIEG